MVNSENVRNRKKRKTLPYRTHNSTFHYVSAFLIKLLKLLPAKQSLFETVIVSVNDTLVELFLNDKIRFVLDARGVNQYFHAPKKPRLGSCASLSELQIPEGESLYIATSDVKDCF